LLISLSLKRESLRVFHALIAESNKTIVVKFVLKAREKYQRMGRWTPDR